MILSEALLRTLRDYWRVYRPSTWLFAGRHPWQPLSIASAQKLFQAACAETDEDAAGAFDGYPCPQCRIGRVRVIGLLAPLRFEGG